MLKEKIKTIIFDIDGTLTTEVSWLKLTEFLGVSKDEHSLIFERFTKNEIDYSTAKTLLINLWISTGNADKDFMENAFKSWDLRENAEEVINFFKQHYNICIISGSVDLYVKTVADKLGISDWYANTELIFNSENKLIDFNYYKDQAAEKLKHLNQYLFKNNLEKGACLIVGNGDSDIALFKELPFGIAVDTDLHSEVAENAYKVITDLSELKGLL